MDSIRPPLFIIACDKDSKIISLKLIKIFTKGANFLRVHGDKKMKGEESFCF